MASRALILKSWHERRVSLVAPNRHVGFQGALDQGGGRQVTQTFEAEQAVIYRNRPHQETHSQAGISILEKC